MKSTIKILESRGYIDKSHILNSIEVDKTLLEKQLTSNIPTDRTKAAIIIGKNNIVELIPNLINALKSESKLYCKIAISETLTSFKDYTVKLIIPYLSKIGKNQHYELPTKSFKKDSYPLPRDIVARILVNIGISVIPEILDNFKTLSRLQTLEAIDILGHISFYTKNSDSLPILLKLYTENKNDNIMTWKLLRSFSAFNDTIIISILRKVIEDSNIKAFIWEAKRSLRLLAEKN